MESVLLDAAGHRRSPATMPGYHQGRPPRNKGLGAEPKRWLYRSSPQTSIDCLQRSC
jgi:hypothetical protein